ncbi:putative transcriptional regulator [Polaribacter sp. Hel1_85]|nr:putative transcriptional regulator [Polaribacter sp. Hel1_85]
MIIKNKETWHYYDNGYLEDDWINLKDFSNWKSGKSPLGYGDDKIITEISFGDNKDSKHITKYFKKKIFIAKKHIAYEFKIQRDDGAVVYINGKELLKDNMPNSIINSTTFSKSTIKGDGEDKFNQHFFDNTILYIGENIISVSIHQAYEDSSDCIFTLELIGHNNPEVLSLVLDKKNKTNEELESKIKDLNTKFEYEKISLQKERLEDTNYNLKILVTLISIIFILSLFGYYFVIDNTRKKDAKNYEQLAILNSENLKKDKEAITLTTNLLHNKQYFKEIKADLKGIKTNDKSIINNIISQIDHVLDRHEDWDILKKHFNAVHDNFYDKLLDKHPTITETELRHCMFIKLHLQTKEIARILLIDPRSVQTARYRIKKKMNLSEDKDLRDYLLNLV